MGILNTYSENSNFWTCNPQMKIPEKFKELHDNDESRNKEKSSKIMYALFFMLDQSEDNKFSNIPEKDREDLIKKDFLREPKFKFEDYSELMILIQDLTLSPANRALANLKKELEERDKFLAATPWNIDTGEKKDKMLANSLKLQVMYDNITKLLQKEKIESKDKGGQKPTASDMGYM